MLEREKPLGSTLCLSNRGIGGEAPSKALSKLSARLVYLSSTDEPATARKNRARTEVCGVVQGAYWRNERGIHVLAAAASS